MTDVPHLRITFLLVAYNQARWIGEALAGAFAQTYEPLEILINDDGSSDGTQQIIRDAVAAYRGPHAVRVNFNATNIGLLPSLNHAFRLATGSFIVVAAGDDVSNPDRVACIAKAMADSPDPVFAIVSDAVAIDEAGREIGPIFNHNTEAELSALGLAERGGYINGACAGYARELIESFGDLDPSIWAEDSLLPFRAALLGRVLHIPLPLVRRRLHPGSMSGMVQTKEGLLRTMRPALAAFASRLVDIDNPKVRSRFGDPAVAQLREAVARSLRRQQVLIELVENAAGSLRALVNAVRRGDIDLRTGLKALFIYRLNRTWRAYTWLSGTGRRLMQRI